MVSWPDAVERINRSRPGDQLNQHKLFRPRPRASPVITMGTSGAGKSELWSSLTGRAVPVQRSEKPDQAYFRIPDHGVSALFTIPGQSVDARRNAIASVFGGQTDVEGLVFVATFGFDHIWPQDANTVASNLDPFDLEALRKRNLREEMWNFLELSKQLIESKLSIAPKKYFPRWILVLVNKCDLFWPEIDSAHKYYVSDPASDFVKAKNSLLQRLGSQTLQIYTLPASCLVQDFVFSSDRGRITSPRTLEAHHCAAALHSVLDTLGELIP